ncbi:MAG: glycoside hydrolase family 11 protein [Oscillospiraceae bacterium]|nr:glycoside hydrolase family 11 protein [Oscillospiraceae bacterium]
MAQIKNDEDFPLIIKKEEIKHYIERNENYHWHNAFELGVLVSGKFDYHINDNVIKLEENDCFFINSDILHMGRQSENNESAMLYTLMFPASLICSDIRNIVYTKYLTPVLNTQIEGFKIPGTEPCGRELKELLFKIYELSSAVFGYELECLCYLNQLWLTLLTFADKNKTRLLFNHENTGRAERMKEILSYVHAHYNERITADDIAAYVKISRGECFRCFKRFMNKSLVEYINEYRLIKAARLLKESGMSVIDIGTECGFENASYFGKVFKDMYEMTPFQYRKSEIFTKNTLQNINGYDYEYYKDTGEGTMTVTGTNANGSFFCNWNNISNIVFRSGKKFNERNQTHDQIGCITLQFDVDYHPYGDSYLCVYGWTVDPLIEWYIIERFTTYKPPAEGDFLGTHETNGSVYELYRMKRENRASVLGMKDFEQYWSVRKQFRSSGEVDVSAHFRAFENAGLRLGMLTEVSFSIEGWLSSGNAVVRKSVITIKNEK